MCYQLVALQSKKLAFLFTPTIALMYDQVKQLKNKGIAATVLDNEYNLLHLANEYSRGNQALVVYLTAEHVYGQSSECGKRADKMEELARKGIISVIALDEAHLVFQWKHFRYYIIMSVDCL